MAHSSLNFSFRRLPRGGAEDTQYRDLYSYTSEVLLPNMFDCWAWSLSASGDFSVSSTRSYIDDVSFPKPDVPTRWIKMVPIKVNILAWKINFDVFPMRIPEFVVGGSSTSP
nr:RNA-directed DNA polymerase, eukaryota, reverse transcriptase zinc-binding domain protein [Tanacetum cinerariifolium]